MSVCVCVNVCMVPRRAILTRGNICQGSLVSTLTFLTRIADNWPALLPHFASLRVRERGGWVSVSRRTSITGGKTIHTRPHTHIATITITSLTSS